MTVLGHRSENLISACCRLLDMVTDEQLAELYLDIARKDLEAADLLYKNDFYPHALFNLQQSVEKTVEALLRHYRLYDLLIDRITAGRTTGRRSIHHKIVKQSFSHFSDGFRNFLINLRRISIDGRPADEYLNSVLERYVKYCDANAIDIINEIELIKRDLETLQNIEFELANQPARLENIIIMVQRGDADIDQEINELFKELILDRISDLRIKTQIPLKRIPLPIVKLMVLGLITEKFVKVTRYYDQQLKLGPKDFDRDNPVVMAWGTFYKTALDTLNYIRNLINAQHERTRRRL